MDAAADQTLGLYLAGFLSLVLAVLKLTRTVVYSVTCRAYAFLNSGSRAERISPFLAHNHSIRRTARHGRRPSSAERKHELPPFI